MLILISALSALAAPCLDANGAPATQPKKTGEQWAAQRNFSSALPCFEAAVAAKPTRSDWINLGSVHYDLAGQLFSQGDEAAGKRHAQQSSESFDKVLATPDPPVRAYILQAANYAMTERSSEGTAMLLELLPTVEEPKIRGAIIDQLGNLSEMPFPSGPDQAAYEQAFDAAKASILPKTLHNGNPSPPTEELIRAGILTLDRALRHHPQSWRAWWVKGVGYQKLGEQGSALEAFGKAYALHPAHPDIGRELVLTHLRMGNAKAAIGPSAEMLVLHPQDPGLLANHALVLMMAGDTDAAASWIEKSLAINPKNPATLALKADIEAVAAGEKSAPERIQ